MPKQPPNPGPNPDRLKIDGDWEESVKKALSKPKPVGGWPTMPDHCPQCDAMRPHTARPVEIADDGTEMQTMVCGACGHAWAKPLT